MRNISHITLKRRLFAAMLLVALLFCCLGARLFYIQIIRGESLTDRAFGQWTRDLPMRAARGDIVDRNGEVLASSYSVFTVYVRPVETADVKATARAIADTCGAEYERIYARINKTGVSEIKAVGGIDEESALALNKLGIDGVYVVADSARYYNYGNFATQLLGFVNADGEGQSGIELYYNDFLKGVDGAAYTQTDLIGGKLDGSSTSYLAPIDGPTARLTIDFTLQSLAEKAVRDAVDKYSPLSASCLMMDADTGEVLAMASAPTYDLNDLPRDDIGYLLQGAKNLLVSDVYEPGSTFKILTAAMGIEEGLIRDSYYCPGYRVVDGKRIRCWRSIGHGSQDFAHGIMNSCNCVFMDIALSAGAETTYSYIEAFGLGSKTGIDVSGEGSGILLPESSVKSVDLARIGFGQAIATTPIGLATAVCSVLNGGKLLTPYVLASIESEDGDVLVENTPVVRGETVSASTSEKMKEYLYSVVEQGGGKNAYVPGYRIGGKTGTAQKYENGSIAQGKYVSSFVGFTEIDGRTVVCLFKVDEPQGYVYYGSIVAAPYVGQIFSGAFAAFGEEPDYGENAVPETTHMPDIFGMSLTQAAAAIKAAGLQYEYSGEGSEVASQFPVAGAELYEGAVVHFSLG